MSKGSEVQVDQGGASIVEVLPDVAGLDPEALTGVRVVAVDTRSPRRQLIRRLLERLVPPAEIAEADSRAAAIDLVDRFHPDLVVLEIQMPLEEGLDTISALRLISPRPRIVVCSFHRDAVTIQGALDRGADAYLTKPVNSADLEPFLAADFSNN
jgi:DNA-binding NarL/FixJ family response regulator